MKERYYYLRKSDEHGVHRCGVVYLILSSDGLVSARGVSFCNKIDPFNRNTGIAKAKGRADKAFYNQESFYPIKRTEAIGKILEATLPSEKFKMKTVIDFKSEYNPVLSEFELNILEK